MNTILFVLVVAALLLAAITILCQEYRIRKYKALLKGFICPSCGYLGGSIRCDRCDDSWATLALADKFKDCTED